MSPSARDNTPWASYVRSISPRPGPGIHGTALTGTDPGFLPRVLSAKLSETHAPACRWRATEREHAAVRTGAGDPGFADAIATRGRADDDVEDAGLWIYNDLDKGIAEAKSNGMPILVVFR